MKGQICNGAVLRATFASLFLVRLNLPETEALRLTHPLGKGWPYYNRRYAWLLVDRQFSET
jgi:hypothetical protein